MDMPHLDLLHALDEVPRLRYLGQPSSPSTIILDEIWVWDRVFSRQSERVIERVVGAGVFVIELVVRMGGMFWVTFGAVGHVYGFVEDAIDR